MSDLRLRQARFAELTPFEVYGLCRLRVDVFVVEQRCPYPELDGRDTEPGTRHLWLADAAGPTAYLRLLVEPDGGHRIGRVCTRGDVRGRGLAAGLVADAVTLADAGPVDLDAQSHLQRWYERLEFTVSGPEFVEDGIPHVPMRRPAHTVRA